MLIPVGSDALDTKTAILHAALECFADHGFDGTSIRMIAERAGRPLSLLSHHFGNKEGLYLEVFRFVLDNKLKASQANRVPRDAAEAIRLLRETIHQIFQETVQSHHDPLQECAIRLWLQEMRATRPALHDLFQAFADPMAATIRNCVQLLRPELRPKEVAFLGASIIGQVVGHGIMRGLNQLIWGSSSMPEPFQAAELLVDQCLYGLIGKRAEA